MSEEEKKAIEFMEEYKDVVYKIPFKTILNLINKQQKEIEELKEKQDYARLEKEQLLEDSISKDKIRKIIYGNYEDLEIILLIKELLEENKYE